MPSEIKIGEKWVGDGHPTYIVAEIGINHNGDLETAMKMIEAMVVWSVWRFQAKMPFSDDGSLVSRRFKHFRQ